MTPSVMAQMRHWRRTLYVSVLAVGAFVAIAAVWAIHVHASDPVAWKTDSAHSQVTFTVTEWGFAEVVGRFHDFQADFVYDRNQPEQSKVEWVVQVASVKTGHPDRDKALQGTPYFESSRFPTLRFVSEKVQPLGDRQLQVKGNITIRGKTLPLTINVLSRGHHDVPGEGRFHVFETDFTLDRYDFGVVGGPVLGPVISREVRVHLVAAIRRASGAED